MAGPSGSAVDGALAPGCPRGLKLGARHSQEFHILHGPLLGLALLVVAALADGTLLLKRGVRPGHLQTRVTREIAGEADRPYRWSGPEEPSVPGPTATWGLREAP